MSDRILRSCDIYPAFPDTLEADQNNSR